MVAGRFVRSNTLAPSHSGRKWCLIRSRCCDQEVDSGLAASSVFTCCSVGVALHTVEFQIASLTDTKITKGESVWRKPDVQQVLRIADQAGYHVPPAQWGAGLCMTVIYDSIVDLFWSLNCSDIVVGGSRTWPIR